MGTTARGSEAQAHVVGTLLRCSYPWQNLWSIHPVPFSQVQLAADAGQALRMPGKTKPHKVHTKELV